MIHQKHQQRYDELEEALIEEQDPLYRKSLARDLRGHVEVMVADAATANSTSGRQVAKKARRLFKRAAVEQAQMNKKSLGNAIKPKPKYVPTGLWLWGMSFFIRINRNDRK